MFAEKMAFCLVSVFSGEKGLSLLDIFFSYVDIDVVITWQLKRVADRMEKWRSSHGRLVIFTLYLFALFSSAFPVSRSCFPSFSRLPYFTLFFPISFPPSLDVYFA